MPSPIEMMIDRACGVTSETCRPNFLTLHCPKCGREQKAAKDDMDPAEAVRLELHCPKCIGSDFETLTYFDKHGAEIIPT